MFAYDPNAGNKDIVFRRGDTVCPYDGEVINFDTLFQRYHNHTAPYTVYLSHHLYEDAAVQRGIGAFINYAKSKETNVALCISNAGGQRHCIIKATKTIRNGHELFTSYGRAYVLNEEGVETATNNKKYTT